MSQHSKATRYLKATQYLKGTQPPSSEGRQNKFSNCRDWRSFLSGAPLPPAYTSVAAALKAGHAWLTGRGWGQGWLANTTPDRQSDSRNLLLDSAGLITGSGKTLGV